jgi:hypothetical protein
MENAIQIAWDYLERTGQIDDPEYTSRFLLDTVEHLVRKGETPAVVVELCDLSLRAG